MLHRSCLVLLVLIVQQVAGDDCGVFRGECPAVVAAPIYCPAAVSTCRSDGDCAADQRCCSDGCHHGCTAACLKPCPEDERCRLLSTCQGLGCPPARAACLKTLPQASCEQVRCPGVCNDTATGPVCSKPGQCPLNDLLPVILGTGNEPDFCRDDFSCPDNLKCCEYGLSKKCVPGCRSDCADTEQCVLKIRPAPCLFPPCPSFRQAVCEKLPPPLTCDTLDCPVDRVCVPQNGGPVCVLRAPSSCAAVSCPVDSVCQVLEGIARCVVPAAAPSGICPVNDVISTCEVKEDACSSDDQCQLDWMCCSHGCGRRCVPACPAPCPPEQQCRFTQVLCVTTPCPFDAATCAP